MDPRRAEAGSALVAVQYGSIEAAASWTDLTRKLKMRVCLKLGSALGGMRGVMDEQAFVESKATMQLMDMNARSESIDVPADLEGDPALTRDESSFRIDNVMVSTEYKHRLLTIVSTEHYQCIVDSAFAILSLARSPAVHYLHISAEASANV